MEKSLRPIYNQIVKISNGQSAEISWNSYNNEMFRCDDEDVSYVFKQDPSVIVVSLKRLYDSGYIEYDDNGALFRLTFRGLHPCEVKFEEVKSFIMKSILTPIVVSIITSFLYSFFTG